MGEPRLACYPDPSDPALILVRVKVIPGASRTEGSGIRESADGPALLVRIAAAPEKGKANDELTAWLAKRVGLPRSAIVLRSGASSRLKILALPRAAHEALRSLCDPSA